MSTPADPIKAGQTHTAKPVSQKGAHEERIENIANKAVEPMKKAKFEGSTSFQPNDAIDRVLIHTLYL